MKLLLDSHALIWAADNPSKLSLQAAAALKDPANELYVSAATVWELSIKIGLGKLSLSLPFHDWMTKAIADLGATILPIRIEHAAAQTQLPGRGDPFDRLLAAQSKVENFSIISSDTELDQYGVRRVW